MQRSELMDRIDGAEKRLVAGASVLQAQVTLQGDQQTRLALSWRIGGGPERVLGVLWVDTADMPIVIGLLQAGCRCLHMQFEGRAE